MLNHNEFEHEPQPLCGCGGMGVNSYERLIKRWQSCAIRLQLMLLFCGVFTTDTRAETTHILSSAFPRPLGEYQHTPGASLLQILSERIKAEPFNLVATIIFICAILHTFLAPKFLRLSHRLRHEHKQKLAERPDRGHGGPARNEVSFWAEAFHFLGEIEAIFGIWVVPLLIALSLEHGWSTARNYVGRGVDFTEPLFVVVIMTMAASRPVLKLSERLLAFAARLGGDSVAAWWFTILTFGPLLGSLITEPAAMTISALLLAEKVYTCRPSRRLAYATLGLLFVDISVGGTLTPFAAPPVLMVAAQWNWGLGYMLSHFGYKAIIGIVIANLVYLGWFRRELRELNRGGTGAKPLTRRGRDRTPPAWVTIIHVLFLLWTVLTGHEPALFIGGFLFYLAFLQATEHHQHELGLRPALLVGFFLAGLVVHGRLQGWWLGPLMNGLGETSLFLAAGALTAFNDNAAITYLASLVPDLSSTLRYAVVAGAVTGGGLTVIANAPNPAGQAILGKFFPDGIAPLNLLLGALVPTVLIGLIFLIF